MAANGYGLHGTVAGGGVLWLACVSLALGQASPAPADFDAEAIEASVVDMPAEFFREAYVHDDGRQPFSQGRADAVTLHLRGQYQLRAKLLSDLPLSPYRRDPATVTLGQTARLAHWLRVTPRATYAERLHLIAQLDAPVGMLAGQTTEHVDGAREPLSERAPLAGRPRWLYLEWDSPVGVVRVGQQPSHWGKGILANDGDHPRLFGDPRDGAIVRRVALATKPAGRDSAFAIAVAGDLVVDDPLFDPGRTQPGVRLYDPDHYAAQGVLALVYDDARGHRVGLYGVYRHQQEAEEIIVGRMLTETLDVVGIDTAGRLSGKIPSMPGYWFGDWELSVLMGSTSLARTIEDSRNDRRQKVLAYGGAMELGLVATAGSGDARFGRWVSALELGWASGDSDPYDGTQRRFTFSPNHTVGLLLFDEVMHWKTARAVSIARDELLLNRPAPGVELLASDGGIFSTAYLYPTGVYRPRRELDIKLGAVLAFATADLVDPVRLNLEGRASNFDGGDPASRFMGLELDAGTEYRIALMQALTLQLGLQIGVLFPGGAFDDASGQGLGTAFAAVSRMGVQF